MSRWLSPDEFAPHAPAMIGAQTRVNHADCPAGRDTKRRLYVKRVQRGIVAYCHHCGLKGAAFKRGGEDVWNDAADPNHSFNALASLSELRRYERAVRWIECYEKRNPALYLRAEYAELWLNDKGFERARDAGAVWGAPDGEEPGLILPIRGPDGRVVGVQVRRVFMKIRGDTRQKYDTFLAEKTTPYIYGAIGVWEQLESGIAVVEDYLSAVRVSKYLPSVVLYGNTCSNETLTFLSLRTNRLIVWLDNDKPEITRAATKIAVQAEPLFDRVMCILDAHEPTKYTDAQLAQILRERKIIA